MRSPTPPRFDRARSRRLDSIVLALEAAEDAVLREAWRRCKAALEAGIPKSETEHDGTIQHNSTHQLP